MVEKTVKKMKGWFTRWETFAQIIYLTNNSYLEYINN